MKFRGQFLNQKIVAMAQRKFYSWSGWTFDSELSRALINPPTFGLNPAIFRSKVGDLIDPLTILDRPGVRFVVTEVPSSTHQIRTLYVVLIARPIQLNALADRKLLSEIHFGTFRSELALLTLSYTLTGSVRKL